MRTGNHVLESVRRTCQLLLGPVVVTMMIASCTSNSTQSGTGGSNSSGGSTGGTTGNGGSGQGGTTAKGGSSGNGGSSSAGGSQAGGSAGSAAGGKAGSQAGGSNAGGSNAGGSAAGGKGGSGSGGSGAAGAGSGGSNADAAATGGKGGSGSGGSGDGGSNPGVDGSPGGAGGGGVTVQVDKKHQTIQGFGLNDALLSSTWSTTVLDNLFTTKGTDAIGLSILRVGMTTSGGLNGTTQSNLDGATSRGAKIIGSCWMATDSCRDKNTLDPTNSKYGGHLLSSCYGSWSDTMVSFATKYKLYAMSIANEPDFVSCGSSDPCNGDYDTMAYTANEMAAFVKVAGPKLQKAGVKVIAAEASEWIHQWSNISAAPDAAGKNSSDALKCGCFGMTIDAATTAKCTSTCTSGDGYDYGHVLAKDSAAWAAFDIVGVHEYDSQLAYAWPSDVTAARKEVWQTEMSGVKWWPEQGPSSDINNGVAVAGWIHSALVTGEASAWLWWWYSAYNTDDNEGLLLKNSTTNTKRYYTLGNYSKFVRPGYIMVDVTGNSNTDVLLSAFTGTDGTVVVAINKGKSAATVPIAFAGGTAPASCTPNVTSATDNLKAGTSVTVTDGSFSASLAASTVTTFVCK